MLMHSLVGLGYMLQSISDDLYVSVPTLSLDKMVMVKLEARMVTFLFWCRFIACPNDEPMLKKSKSA